MKVIITARELMDCDRWERACTLASISPWAVSDGRMDIDEELTLPAEVADKLGLLAPGVYVPDSAKADELSRNPRPANSPDPV